MYFGSTSSEPMWFSLYVKLVFPCLGMQNVRGVTKKKIDGDGLYSGFASSTMLLIVRASVVRVWLRGRSQVMDETRKRRLMVTIYKSITVIPGFHFVSYCDQ